MLCKNLRLTRKEKILNEIALSRTGIKRPTLLQNIKKLKLGYFGHIKRHQSLEKHILEAKIEGRKGRGRPARRYEQDIEEWLGTTTTHAGRLAGDRSLFRRKVRETTSWKGIS